MILSAVMPLPEGMSELTFAGALQKRAIRMIKQHNAPAIYAEADFCISGIIDPEGTKTGRTIRRSPGILQPPTSVSLLEGGQGLPS